MKKNIIAIIFAIIVIIIVLSCIVVFAQSDRKEATIQDKVSQEIEYLDSYIVSLLGNFNGLSIQNGIIANEGKYDADWEALQSKIEELYQIWNTVSIDLYSLNTIDKSYILTFSDNLNNSTQNIKNKEKEKAMDEVVKLYQLLPQYSQSYKQDSKETNMLKIQSNVVTAYVYATNEKWQEANTQLLEAEKQFASLLNSVEQEFKDQSSANQCYILINELIKATNIKDKEIFFIEFQNFIEKVETV